MPGKRAPATECPMAPIKRSKPEWYAVTTLSDELKKELRLQILSVRYDFLYEEKHEHLESTVNKINTEILGPLGLKLAGIMHDELYEVDDTRDAMYEILKLIGSPNDLELFEGAMSHDKAVVEWLNAWITRDLIGSHDDDITLKDLRFVYELALPESVETRLADGECAPALEIAYELVKADKDFTCREDFDKV